MTTSRRPRDLSAALLLLTLLVSGAHAQTVPFEDVERPIPWVEVRLGRFFQSNQWKRLDQLSRSALEVALQNDLKDLKTEAQWYQTLVLAQKGAAPADVFAALEKAIEYGYRSVQGLDSAEQLTALKADPTIEPKYRKLVAQLEETVADEAQATFQGEVDGQVAKLKSLSPGSLGVHAITKPDGATAAETGQPVVIVLSRTYHAGFRKQWPVLERAVAPFSGRITALALFYENDAQSAFIQGEVARFAKVTGVEDGDYAIIDRERFKELRDAFAALHDQVYPDTRDGNVFDLYFPFTFVVDGEGHPLFSASGNLNARQITYVLEKSLAGLPVPEKTEEPDGDETEESSERKPEASGDSSKDAPKNGEEQPEEDAPKNDDESPEEDAPKSDEEPPEEDAPKNGGEPPEEDAPKNGGEPPEEEGSDSDDGADGEDEDEDESAAGGAARGTDDALHRTF